MAASGEEPPAEPPLGEDRADDLQVRPEEARPADLGEARPADLGKALPDEAHQGPVLPVTTDPAEVLCFECGKLVPINMCQKNGGAKTNIKQQFKCNPCNAMHSRLHRFLNKSGSSKVAQDLCALLVLRGYVVVGIVTMRCMVGFNACLALSLSLSKCQHVILPGVSRAP